MDESEAYEKFDFSYEIQLTGSAIFRMNSWWLEGELDWNSYFDGIIYLT
jgi:hypothetical protein